MKKGLDRIRHRLLKTPSHIGKYKRKNIVLLLLFLCVPSLLIGILINFFGVSQLKKDFIETHEKQIINQVDYIDSQMQSLEVNLNYWSYENLFNNNIDQINFQDQYQLAREISGSLFSKQNGNSLIERISLFVNSETPFVFNPQFRWTGDDQLSNYQYYLQKEDTFYWDQNLLMSEEDHHLFPLVLVKNIPTFAQNQKKTNVSFIVELNQQAVLQMIDGLSLASEGFSFIVDKQSGMLISSDMKSNRFVEEVLIEQGLGNDSFTVDWEGEDYSVSSGTINRVNADWLYISVVPISFMTKPINQLSQTIMIISLIGLVLSFIIANVTFRSIYRPVEKILELFKGNALSNKDAFHLIESNWKKLNNEKELLENHVATLNEKLISNFFFQLVEGFLQNQSERELRMRLAQYQIYLDHETLRYLDIQVSSKKHQSYIIKWMNNIFDESYYVIHFNDHFLGIIFIIQDNEQFEEQINELYSAIKADHKFELAIMYLSQPVQDLSDLTQAVEKIRQRKYKTRAHDQLVLIHMPSVIKNSEQAGDIYPFEIERRILKAIDLSEMEQVTEGVDQFVAAIQEYDERSIQYNFIQLYGSIQARIMKEGIYPFELFEGKNIVKEFIHAYDMDTLKAILLDDVIQPFIMKRKDHLICKQTQMIHIVTTYIEQNYMYDISLDQCADELGLNSYTLSKMFKQCKGINFIDYLTNYRIEQAKHLLSTSTIKIQEIATSVGYQHSYFNRIFKKHTNMTPGQYRKMQQTANLTQISNFSSLNWP
ncbi:AraC family transcriptional regulator [Amphibacillus sp. MSJ-3]|uniref:AraC family transcriptional regulator n=1 Tax=Amphibacillus sp. MSJ-3 TaxID=2841505 RepID=UPI001C0EA065|nr:AraC family transcriptional regulator [Amphibacillus sp. MSJ-3]MBU5593819.1 AraC family transcriptional regulator [Amphibacillus sp. MSJ-3]